VDMAAGRMGEFVHIAPYFRSSSPSRNNSTSMADTVLDRLLHRHIVLGRYGQVIIEEFGR